MRQPHPDRVRRHNLMKLIPSKAYRCTACGKRFYRIGTTGSSSFMPTKHLSV
ncbi:hypothetical protein GO730_11385 [Spirosoma sp. HMF3257]|uniref:hypothetical protein n=1 Tax=Spirosoma telluris TaxID=2183553 RepID=UPI0012FBDA71|nr:hypothetical protein [Spirosoma telluris]